MKNTRKGDIYLKMQRETKQNLREIGYNILDLLVSICKNAYKLSFIFVMLFITYSPALTIFLSLIMLIGYFLKDY